MGQCRIASRLNFKITFCGSNALPNNGKRGVAGAAGVHKSFHPTIWDGSTWSKFGARGEHGDVLRFSTEVFSGSPT